MATRPLSGSSVLNSCSPALYAKLRKQIPKEAQIEADRLFADHLCSRWVLSHHAGPMFWLRNFTKTFNFQWERDHAAPEAPFPYRPYRDRALVLNRLPFPHEFSEDDPPDYLDILMGFMLFTKDIAQHDELWIPKTRQMLTSWLTVGYITWHCQFHPRIEWIGQSEDDLKATGNIKYANALYSNQEPWQKALHPLASGIEGISHKIEWANGSLFRALASGVRKFASSHAHGYMSDETAHIVGAEATLNIVKPAVKQIICVSSVAPGFFWTQVNQTI